jgi:hypothetical protein
MSRNERRAVCANRELLEVEFFSSFSFVFFVPSWFHEFSGLVTHVVRALFNAETSIDARIPTSPERTTFYRAEFRGRKEPAVQIE